MLKDLSAFFDIIVKHAEINSVALFKAGSTDLGRKIATDTPVKTGRATANWRFGVNREVRGVSTDFHKTKTAIKTWRHMVQDVSKATLKDTLILKNQVNSGDEADEDYIIKLEEGKSKQAPTGMFMKNITGNNAQKSFDKSWKKIKRKPRKTK